MSTLTGLTKITRVPVSYTHLENKRLINLLRVVLAENRKTSKWLAEQLRVSAVIVSKWCSNIHQTDLQTFAKIADLISCEKR